jgi:SAM-dependent methyltransferase
MSAVVWHDVECGAYSADLGLWRALADESEGAILDLGCGTGRVALHLAKRGHRVVGLDSDASLLAAFDERVGGLPADAVLGDARGFELGDEFGLILAPMQLVQLFVGAAERIDCLRCVVEHLRPGGKAALAIAEKVLAGSNVDLEGALPDTREVDRWVYSSLPLDLTIDSGTIVVRRLRQTVSPAGELSDEVDTIELRVLSADTLEREASEAGLKPAGRRQIPATDAHIGSTVVLLEAP